MCLTFDFTILVFKNILRTILIFRPRINFTDFISPFIQDFTDSSKIIWFVRHKSSPTIPAVLALFWKKTNTKVHFTHKWGRFYLMQRVGSLEQSYLVSKSTATYLHPETLVSRIKDGSILIAIVLYHNIDRMLVNDKIN